MSAGRDLEPAVLAESGLQLLGGELAAVAADAREDDLKRAPLLDGVDARHRLRLRRLGLLRRRGEVEGDPHDVGIFDIEEVSLRVEIVGLAAQSAADHLLAQELGAEGAQTEDMGDGVGVPALGQHRHRDDAADLLAEPALAADRVHHLAQQRALARVLPQGAGTFAGGDLALELLDLRGGRLAEALVERVAGFELARVDQQRARAGQAATLFVVVAEQFEMAGVEGGAFAFGDVATLEAGDPVEHQLGDGGVLANDDEHRGDVDAGPRPALELAFVVAVERVQRRLQHRGQIEGAELAGRSCGLRQLTLPTCFHKSR